LVENNGKDALAAAFKRSLEIYGGCFERICSELSSLSKRVGELEVELVGLADRVCAMELKAGTVATEKIAEDTFHPLSLLER
jgi:hypothetical protein